MSNESIFLDLSALVADGAKAAAAGKRAKELPEWIGQTFAKVNAGESVAIAADVWEKANARARKAYKDANDGWKLKATAYKNGKTVVAYVVSRERDI